LLGSFQLHSHTFNCRRPSSVLKLLEANLINIVTVLLMQLKKQKKALGNTGFSIARAWKKCVWI